jgi:glycosyltransferase involved in cell wall biosynthesis
MTVQPLITVIVPVYRVEQYLHQCVDSVINQTYTNIEIILVNDGSPDNCPLICDEYAAKDKRVKVIHKKNGGLSSARNVALDNAKGEYITFLDSDDFWHVDYLRIMVNLCLKHEADIVQCSFIRGTECVFPEIKKKYKIKVFDNHSIFLKSHSKIIIWAKLYKRQLFDGIRMPEGKINEDDYTTWKLYYKAKRILVINQALYYYTNNEQSIMAVQKKQPHLGFLEAYDERIDIFKRNGEKELEDFSRAHLCKSMLLININPMLSREQKEIVDATFLSNWKEIQCSENVSLTLKALFLMFHFLPKVTLRLLNMVR